ncbi:MAG: HAD family phosphatase [Candidatus Margulisbacteria bacterium]|nr:HAD family phosphatase [Candidatus Margulisiibacteriota bacterium]
MLLNKIKIAFFDIDGTIHRGDTLWEAMHKKLNTWESLGRHYLEQFSKREIDYEQFARLDVEAWAGAHQDLLEETITQIEILPETIYLFEKLLEKQIRIYLISNGIAQLAGHIVERFGLTGYRANPLEIEDKKLTGRINIILPYDHKGNAVRSILEKENIKSSQAMAVGDGPSDLHMLREVAFPVYYNDHHYPSDYNGFVAKNWSEILCYLGLKQGEQ